MGQTSCTACPANTGTLTEVSSILPDGTAIPYPGTLTQAQAYERGRGSTNVSNCVTCPTKQVALQGVCMYCPAGFEYDSNGNCRICPRNTYNDRSARFGGYCMSCPENRWQTANEGSLSFEDCVVFCANNQKFDKTSNTCMWCDPGYYSDTATTCTACANGTFMAYRSVSPLCQACPIGQTNIGVGNTTCY
jgi:hypothetical protein